MRTTRAVQTLIVLGAGLVLVVCLVGGFVVLQLFFPDFVIGSREVRVPAVRPQPLDRIFYAAPAPPDPERFVWVTRSAVNTTNVPLPLPKTQAYALAWSPDGRMITFTVFEANNEDLFVMQRDGTGVRQLTNTAAKEGYGVWMPDGQRLRFLVQHAHGSTVEEIRADGTERRSLMQLTHPASYPPRVTWSPDGTRLIVEKSPDATISVLTEDGAVLVPPLAGGAASWSLDGQRIAFVQGNQLVVMHADGTQRTPLATGMAYLLGPLAWSPDGTRIAFGRREYVWDSPAILCIIGADGRSLVSFKGTEGVSVGPVDWSPDGEWLLFHQSSGPGAHTIWGFINILGVESGEIISIGGGGSSGWVPQLQ